MASNKCSKHLKPYMYHFIIFILFKTGLCDNGYLQNLKMTKTFKAMSIVTSKDRCPLCLKLFPLPNIQFYSLYDRILNLKYPQQLCYAWFLGIRLQFNSWKDSKATITTECSYSAILFCNNVSNINLILTYNHKMNHLGSNPDSKVHAAHMGPTWVLSAPGGPHVGPVNLAVREGMYHLPCITNVLYAKCVPTYMLSVIINIATNRPANPRSLLINWTIG